MSREMRIGQPAAAQVQVPIELPQEGSDHILYSDFAFYRDALSNEAVSVHMGHRHKLHQLYRIQLR